jgi:succinate--hydroxymethylglutarate CoA-transferase
MLNICPTVMMVIRSQCAISTLPRVWRYLGKRKVSTIGSTGPETNEKLPLAGIRVLDMTRVLAGVCCCFITNDLETEADGS